MTRGAEQDGMEILTARFALGSLELMDRGDGLGVDIEPWALPAKQQMAAPPHRAPSAAWAVYLGGMACSDLHQDASVYQGE